MILIPETICGWTPSHYQRAILGAVVNAKENLIIQACAGSGKTSTLEMICSLLPENQRSIAVCFNKSIQMDFSEKLPGHIECKTLHSVGYAAIRNAVPGRVNVDYKKVDRLIKKYCDTRSILGKSIWNLRQQLPRMVSLCLGTLTDPLDQDALVDLADDYALSVSNETFRAIPPVIKLCRAEKDKINFDDMMDHPLALRYPIPQYDLVLVDEAQDLNLQQMAILKRMLAGGGRLIAVGDRFQAIYGFRGACSTAMDLLKDKYACTELPLSYCYRCGTSIVSEAQEIVGEDVIQSPDGQHSGIIEMQDEKAYEHTMLSLKPGDMVVCRTNAPLVRPCLNLIKQGKNASIRGAAIGGQLIGIIDHLVKHNALNSGQITELKREIGHWERDKIEQALDRRKPAQAQYYQDVADTLMDFLVDADHIPTIKKTIKRVFSDDNGVEISFSTIHKAKGLEASTVVYLGPEIVPHPMAKRFGNAESLQQEDNLDYVARTRAKDLLIYQQLPKKE